MPESTYQDLNQVLLDIVNRLRSLESKYNLLGERLLVVNQNMINQFKKNNVEIKTADEEVKELKTELFKTREAIKDLTREMQFFATKEDFKVLEKYINLWNPMKFITEKDLEKALESLKAKKRHNGTKRIKKHGG